jgi:ectoine hydroxylase-related dioxygenase (phytanoyl-CoA dioxygenase family)
LPASQKSEAFPSDAYIKRMEQSVSAEPGSYILIDSMLYHRAGVNRSSASRRAVNNVYALPIIKQQIVLPSLLNGRWSEDPFLARLLGYESDPPANVDEYRARRQARPGTQA